jgi:hypothetical protein
VSAGFDGQFVIVTLAAAWGAWVLLRPLWASRKGGKPTGACGNCSSVACKPVERAEASAAFSSSGSGSGSGLVAIGSGAPRRAKGAAGPPPGGGV